jgi:DnaK suppressor protein
MKHISEGDMRTLTSALEKERTDLEAELRDHGRKVGGDWQGTAQGFETEEPDDIDAGDKMEELATNVPLVETLERRLTEVIDALKRVDAGSYGLDERTGKPIRLERLLANPAARTDI